MNDNSAIYGIDIGAYPIEIQFLNGLKIFELENVPSG